MYSFCKVNDNFYYVEGRDDAPVAKICILVGSDASMLVDVGNENEQILNLYKGINDFNLPEIKYIVITHFHDDHIKNAPVFKNIPFLLSKYTSKYVQNEKIIIDKSTTINLGDFEVVIDKLPNSHSKGSLLIYAKKIKTMFIGDCLCGKIRNDEMFLNRSSTYEMIKKIREYDTEQYVDGHSSLEDTSKEQVESILSKYEDIFKGNSLLDIKM